MNRFYLYVTKFLQDLQNFETFFNLRKPIQQNISTQAHSVNFT